MTMQQVSYKRNLRIVLTLTCVLAISPLAAQDPFGGDNPFGGAPMDAANDAFGAQPATKPAAQVAPGQVVADDPDPIIRMLRSNPPKTPNDIADGLTWTIRLKRWDEVGRLLDRVQSLNWTLEQKATAARRMGTAMILRMRTADASISDAQKNVAGELLQAPAQLVQDPAWIDQAIDKLASLVPAERRSAQLKLHDASSSAIARLVNRLLAGDAKVPALQLATAASSFGGEGAEALRTACLVRDKQAAARVISALADLSNQEFGTELGASLYSRLLTAETQAALSQKLAAKYPSIPSPQAVEAHLNTRFEKALQTYQQQREAASAFMERAWRPAANGDSSIELVEVSPADKALEAVSRLAAHRMQLQAATNAGLVDSAAVLLQRAYKLRPQLLAGELPSFLLADLAPEVTRDLGWWQQVFARCQELQLHGAAIRSLQLMADGIDAGDFDASISFLTKLLKDPTPAIRYSALESLAKLDPKVSYYGNEWAMETAVEMTRLQNGPHALVIGLQSELRQAAQQQINLQTGSDVTIVNSGAAALKVLDEAIPVELIFIVDRVADQSISQLVQRLRNTERGRSLPIAILTEQLYSYEREVIDDIPGVVTSLLTRNPEQMQRVMEMLSGSLDTTLLAPTDRANFSALASRFLSHISSNRQHYAFYPLGSWHSAILEGSSQVPEITQIGMLSGLGTAESQWKLANMTLQSNLAEAKRLEAVRAFAKSVRQFGMNIHRENVIQAYKSYNEVGPKDPVAAKAMGLVLDVIEAQAGKAPWPEGL